MKKTILITSGTILILLIVATWIYLILFGAPKDTAEVFTRFGLGGGGISEETIFPSGTLPSDEEEVVLDTTPARLRQLTTRPVAGAGFASTSIRYVEQGTGHVYEIDLVGGTETLISGTTLPQATHAIFSGSGDQVAITSFATGGTKTIVGDVVVDPSNGGELKGVALPQNAEEIAFNEAGTGVYYLLKKEAGSSGYLYDLEEKRSVEVFNIPLRDVRVLWGTPLYVYTTPTVVQTGYIYEIRGKNVLEHVTRGMQGLVATSYENGLVVSSITNEGREYVAITESGEIIQQAIPFVPEKCITNPLEPSTVFCALPQNMESGSFPDDWYMGAISYSDTLWEVDVLSGQATVLLDFLAESGRQVDVRAIGTDTFGIKLFFINKNDNTLWLFDRSVRE